MDAPVYPPAVAFEQPVAAPYVLSIDNSSLAELMKVPEAWAIVVKHLPALKMMVSQPQMKPHLGNFSVRTVAMFIKAATPDAFAAIDAELARLPPVQESTR